MRTLVTGSAGFIGSHLCERLLKDGHSVIGVDNLSSGRAENVKHLTGPNFSQHYFDIENSTYSLDALLDGVDWVFHLAARADIVPSIVNPLEYFRSNVSGTVKVLEASRRAKIKKFVYAASSSCYGIPDEYPTKEGAPIRPEYPYALTKYLGEECVLHWSMVYQIPAISLRLTNVYGPRSRTTGTYGAVFGTFLSQIYHGHPPTVVGDGFQSRDFTYVTDVVDAFVKAAGTNTLSKIFNVGSGRPQTINNLVKLLGAEVVEFIPKRPGEPEQTFVNAERIKTELKWQPKVSFEEGVKIMLDALSDYRDAPLWTPEKIKEATADWFKYLGGK